MKHTMSRRGYSSLGMVQTALFAALIVALSAMPFIGYIYIPILLVSITTIHIPVILGSILLGPKRGAVLGGVFGLTSLINNTLYPKVTSFVFSPFYEGSVAQGGGIGSLVICFVPRILVGIVPYYVYKFLSRKDKRRPLALAVAGFAGSMTNTLLVMNLIYLLFGQQWAAAQGKAGEFLYGIILGVIGMNGVPEAIAAAVLTLLVGGALLRAGVGRRQ